MISDKLRQLLLGLPNTSDTKINALVWVMVGESEVAEDDRLLRQLAVVVDINIHKRKPRLAEFLRERGIAPSEHSHSVSLAAEAVSRFIRSGGFKWLNEESQAAYGHIMFHPSTSPLELVGDPQSQFGPHAVQITLQSDGQVVVTTPNGELYTLRPGTYALVVSVKQ